MKILINTSSRLHAFDISHVSGSDKFKKKFKKYEISNDDLVDLRIGKIKIDFEKTTSKKLRFLKTTKVKTKSEVSIEVQMFIYSKFSKTDQENIKAQILYEREILGEVSKETKEQGKYMFEWIRSVLDEFRKNGAKTDLTKFDNNGR